MNENNKINIYDRVKIVNKENIAFGEDGIVIEIGEKYKIDFENGFIGWHEKKDIEKLKT